MPGVTLPDRPEVVGINHTAEDADFRALLNKNGARILSERPIAVGTLMGGEAAEIHYILPDGRERWAYIVPHRLGIDAFGEESLICMARLPDADAVADTILLLRKREG